MKLQVGVKVLLKNARSEYLLIKRAVKFGDEAEPHWDIPGGRINENESLMDALRREVLEETGLELAGEPVLIFAQDIFVAKAGLHVVRLTYSAAADGDVVVSNEHEKFRWTARSELEKLNIDPYLRETLQRLK